MVPSKALWRDVRVLEHLEWTLAAQGKRAVMFIVSTASPTGRRAEDVFRWEAEYGWPLGHRGDNGDLARDEIHFFYHVLEPFHWGRSATKICLVNQFGWEREPLRLAHARGDALRRPAQRHRPGVRPVDLRAVRHRPGGAAERRRAVRGVQRLRMRGVRRPGRRAASLTPNLVVADYVSVPPDWKLWSPWDALRIDEPIRNSLEARNSYLVAQQIAERLPRNDEDRRRLLDAGQRLAAGMSWEVVVKDYLLPALGRC